jgi:hypothetical protein
MSAISDKHIRAICRAYRRPMQTETVVMHHSHSQPEVRSALRKIQEQAQLLTAEHTDRATLERMLLIIALTRFCLASMPLDRISSSR